MAAHSDVMALRYVRARVIPVQQVRQSKTATLALQLFNAPPPLLPTISTDIKLTLIPHVCKRSNDPFLPLCLCLCLYSFTQGRVTLPKQMSFRKSFKRLLTPLHFPEMMVQFFWKTSEKSPVLRSTICNINFKIENDHRPSFGTFPKIHPFWQRHPSLTTYFYEQCPDVAVVLIKMVYRIIEQQQL